MSVLLGKYSISDDASDLSSLPRLSLFWEPVLAAVFKKCSCAGRGEPCYCLLVTKSPFLDYKVGTGFPLFQDRPVYPVKEIL